MDVIQMKCARCARPMELVRLQCPDCGLAVEGRFSLPPLAQLTVEEQVFVTAFVRVHGNIRKMEALFGISYPTVKNRLNGITRKLDAPLRVPAGAGAVLDRLSRGEITFDQALELLLGP
jgi:hypothetical protein